MATCYSVMMDEASDCGHQEQVSVVIRYVDVNHIIQERLVNIENTNSTDAESLFRILLSTLEQLNLSTDLLIGQCYDGASNMRGHIAGVQATVQPKALYTHCYAHYTNLVLVEATSYARHFFGTLQNLYSFLEASPHRHAKLQSIIAEVVSKPRVKSIKKLSDTRWACRSDAILAIHENYIAIVQALKQIEKESRNGEVAAEASGLHFKVHTFEFLMCLVVLKDILVKCRTVSDYLQREDIDIISSLQLVDTTVKTLKEMRNERVFKIVLC